MCSLQFCVGTISMRTIALISILFFARTVSAAVFINEIAWMGTTVSPSNEWIELASDGSTPVDMAGWVLSIEGKKDIALSGSISPGGFYLIERTDDTTVPTVPADLVASFGTGLANTGAIISLRDAGGAVVDRVDGSQGWNIGGTAVGNNTTKETAQKGMTGWTTGAPTPRAINVGVVIVPTQEAPATPVPTNTPSGNSSFPVEPQIFADAGVATRIVSTGAPVVFVGHVFGFKKEPIENARMVWSFGDGGRAEGTSVAHTYYYPGDYIAVLDAASGYYGASDRVAVRVVAPQFAIHTGGDSVRSFVAIENRGGDEIDLSLWQIQSAGKTFILPQNTILGARKTLTLASEVTGLVTPVASVAFLHFPNGTRVEMQSDAPTPVSTSSSVQVSKKEPAATGVVHSLVVAPAHSFVPKVPPQEALVANAFADSVDLPSTQESGSLWPWYSGAAFLGALALLGLRMTREKKTENPSGLTAGGSADRPGDDFEIIEDDEDKKDDLF